MENLDPLKAMQEMVLVAEKNKPLTAEQVNMALTAIFSGQLETPIIERWLRLVSGHIPTAPEIFGGVQALLNSSTPIPTNIACEKIIDTAGTGGAPKMLNVSTLSALVIAACRGIVAKSGNRSRTGFGSSETLAALGVNIQTEPDLQAKMLAECGFCFAWRPNIIPRPVSLLMPARPSELRLFLTQSVRCQTLRAPCVRWSVFGVAIYCNLLRKYLLAAAQ